MSQVRLALIAVLALVLVSGCVSKQDFVHPEYHQRVPSSVAVLPPINATIVDSAEKLMQFLMAQQLDHSWYFYGRCQNALETRAFLESKGMYSGGRFGRFDGNKWIWPPSPSPEDMCKDLGVGGLLVGQIETFQYTEAVIARSRKVEVTWMLCDSNGEVLWRGTGIGQTFHVSENFEEGLKDAGKALAIRTIEEAAKAPLYVEALAATKMCIRSLPRSRWSGAAPGAPRIPGFDWTPPPEAAAPQAPPVGP